MLLCTDCIIKVVDPMLYGATVGHKHGSVTWSHTDPPICFTNCVWNTWDTEDYIPVHRWDHNNSVTTASLGAKTWICGTEPHGLLFMFYKLKYHLENESSALWCKNVNPRTGCCLFFPQICTGSLYPCHITFYLYQTCFWGGQGVWVWGSLTSHIKAPIWVHRLHHNVDYGSVHLSHVQLRIFVMFMTIKSISPITYYIFCSHIVRIPHGLHHPFLSRLISLTCKTLGLYKIFLFWARCSSA